MYVIDINTAFGRSSEYDFDLALNTLLTSLDGHQIAGALSYSLRGVHYDSRAGNRESFAAARAHPHLIPVATLDLRDSLGWQDELAFCLQQGARVFRFFPQIQGWSVATRLFQQVLARLSGAGVALVFSTAEAGFGGWGAAEEIANLTADRGLPVILTDTNYNNMAEVISLMQQCPHLYAETNWLATVGAVEVMAEEVGAHRLLFGSAAPFRPLQKALNQVLETSLSAEDKAAILGGNAIRLLKLAPDALADRPQLASLEPQGLRRTDHRRSLASRLLALSDPPGGLRPDADAGPHATLRHCAERAVILRGHALRHGRGQPRYSGRHRGPPGTAGLCGAQPA